MQTRRLAAGGFALAVVFAAGAKAQAPSLEDLARLHGGAAAGKVAPAPAPGSQASPGPFFGAIAFTADGSYSTAWKHRSKAEAEADVAKRCAAFGRGECKVIGFPGALCAGLAAYRGTHSGRRYRLAFTGGGTTAAEAQQAALGRCNADPRTRRRCELRTVVCGDGR